MGRSRLASIGASVVAVLLASASHAATFVYTAALNGTNENPTNSSTAAGTATITIDTTAQQMAVTLTFSGLTAAATAAHLHCCASAPTNAAVLISLTALLPAATSGSYTTTFDMTQTSFYSGTFVADNGGTAAGAEAALMADLTGGTVYANIHTSTYPGGEIRGYPALVVPDLTISKTHAGSFRQSQTGAQYTITVTNNGTGPTSGAVTVTDTLPAGLTATSFGGSGWTCSALPALSCSRSDALGAGNSYPDITLVVDVAADAPAGMTNAATVSGGGEVDTSNDGATDPTTVVQTIPLLGRGGVAALAALLVALGVFALRRRTA